MGKNKVRKAEFVYKAGVELDDVLELGTRLKKARDAVHFHHFVDCNVELCGDTRNYYFNVSLGDLLSSTNLDAAYIEYISIAGLPRKVYSNYGFDGIKQALPADKTLYPIGFLGRLFGAHIVRSK